MTVGTLGCVEAWRCTEFLLCSYCASPGREGRPLAVVDGPVGSCVACGEALESMRCVSGQPCDPGHGTCPDCGFGPYLCFACDGSGYGTGCVACHGTGVAIPGHCCDCQMQTHDGCYWSGGCCDSCPVVRVAAGGAP